MDALTGGRCLTLSGFNSDDQFIRGAGEQPRQQLSFEVAWGSRPPSPGHRTIARIEGGARAGPPHRTPPRRTPRGSSREQQAADRPHQPIPRVAVAAAAARLPPLRKYFKNSVADDLRVHRASPPSEGGDGNTSSGTMAAEKRDERRFPPPTESIIRTNKST